MMTLLTLVVVVAPLAGPVERPVIGATVPGRSCSSVDVQPIPRASHRASRAWTARRVVDLEIRTSLRKARGSRPVELRVLTPGGQLYQTLTAAAAMPAPADSESPSRGRTGPGRVATVRLPVAGTHITQRGLYGRWSVVPYLEGDLEPCGPPALFTLVP